MSVHGGGGVCLSACWDARPPPGPGRPPQDQVDTNPPRPGRHPLGPGRHPHQVDTPPGPGRHPLPRTRQTPPRDQADTPLGSRLQHTVYERPVRILLECILVTGVCPWGGLYDVTSCLAAWSRFFQRVSVQSDFCLEGSLSSVGGLYPGGSLSGRLPCTVKRGYPTGMLSCFIGLFRKCKKYVDLGLAPL